MNQLSLIEPSSSQPLPLARANLDAGTASEPFGGVSLWPHQERAIRELRAEIAGGKRRLICYLPTGGGKTRTAAAMIASALGKGKRAVFLCHRVKLIRQASEAFTALGIDHGILQGGNSRGTWKSMVVASIQTVATRGLDDFDLIIIDEAHRAASRRDYRALMAKFADKIVIGLTATPFAKGLGAVDAKIGGPLFEGIIIGSTIRDLIKSGVLVDCEIYAPSEPDVSAVKIVAGEYQQDQLAEVSDQPELIGDIVQHWLKHANGEQTICFATRIEHSRHIVEQFIKAGVTALHVDSYMEPEDQDEIYHMFESGDAVVLSNVGMLEEGFDVPATAVMIDAKPTKSLTAWIQRCGRVLRSSAGKSGALILDHAGNANRLGFPTDDLPLELDDGSKAFAERKEARQAKRLEPRKCPSCFMVRQPGVKACPCGHTPVVGSGGPEIGDGELQRLDRNAPKSSKKSKSSKATPADKQQWFSMLTHIARERGYKPGWAANHYRMKFDVWPRGLTEAPVVPNAEVASWVRSRQIAYAKSRKSEPVK